MGSNGRDREQLRADATTAIGETLAEGTSPEPAGGPPLSLLPMRGQYAMGFQNDEEGNPIGLVLNIHAPGVALMLGLDADQAKAIGEALIERAAQVPPPGPHLSVATAAEVEHVQRRRTR